jgi:hypothetical protein
MPSSRAFRSPAHPAGEAVAANRADDRHQRCPPPRAVLAGIEALAAQGVSNIEAAPDGRNQRLRFRIQTILPPPRSDTLISSAHARGWRLVRCILASDQSSHQW